MIYGRKHADKISRVRQEYDTRLDKVRLGMNEHVPKMPDDLFNKIMAAFTNEMASAYPEVNRAYTALSAYIKQPRDRLLLTSGADMAIRITLEAFCEPGDIILTCAPTFAMYKIHAQLLNCDLQEVYCDSNGDFNLQHVLSAIEKNPRIFIIANPNGVTGHCFSVDELQILLSHARNHGVLAVIDETYADFADVDATSLLDKFDNLVVIRSFSKNIGFAGLRIGYIVTTEYLAEIIEKFKPMMEINSLAVLAIKTVCSDGDLIKREVAEIVKTRHDFAENIKKLGFRVIEKHGNFVLVNFGSSTENIIKELIASHIEFRKLSGPLTGYIRFTIATKNIMQNLIKIISNA